MTSAAAPSDPEGILWFDGPAALLRLGPGTDPWLRGVALGAVGRYADAAALLEPLGSSLALSTLASHARQVGRHAEAEALDTGALDLADSPAAAADATSGLVADALGRGDADLAQSRVRAAFDAVFDWRSGIRYHWVVAELALLLGDPRTAAAEADEGLRVARWKGVPRHVAKSLLVRGVARHVARRDGADDLLAALASAQELGLPTLVWPAAQVGAEALPARAAELRAAARDALTVVVAGLGTHGAPFAARAEIADLLDALTADVKQGGATD
jgi:hypothetical protein